MVIKSNEKYHAKNSKFIEKQIDASLIIIKIKATCYLLTLVYTIYLINFFN